MPDDIYERIRAIVARNQRRPIEDVTIDSTFEELGIDSLDGVNLLFEIEGEFDIAIPDDQAKSIKSVRQMVEGVQKLLAARPGGSAVSA